MTTKTTEGTKLSREDLARVDQLAEEGRILDAEASELRKKANKLAGDASKKFAEANLILRGKAEVEGPTLYDPPPTPVSLPVLVPVLEHEPQQEPRDEPKGPPVDAMRLEVQMPGEEPRSVVIVTHAPEGDPRFTPEGRGCSTFKADELAIDPLALELAFKAARPIFPGRTGNGPDDETPAAFRPELGFGDLVRAFAPPVAYAAVRCAMWSDAGQGMATYTLWPVVAFDDWPKERKTFVNFAELRKLRGGGAPESIDLDGMLVDVDGEPCVFGEHMGRIYVNVTRGPLRAAVPVPAPRTELERHLPEPEQHPVPKIEPLAAHKKAAAAHHLDVKYGLNANGVYTKPKKVVVPVPKSVNGHVTLQVAQGGDGRWRGHADYGLKGTGVGAFGCGGLPGAGRGNTYATEDECLHAQVVEVLKNLDARAETPRARKLAEAVRAKWPEAPKLTNVRYIRDKTPKPKAAAPGARPLSYGQWLATFRSVYQVEQPRTPGAPVWSKVETDGRLLELFKQYPKLRPSDAARGFVAAAAADDDEGDGDGREWRGA